MAYLTTLHIGRPEGGRGGGVGAGGRGGWLGPPPPPMAPQGSPPKAGRRF